MKKEYLSDETKALLSRMRDLDKDPKLLNMEEVKKDQSQFFHRIQELKKNTHRPLSAMLEKGIAVRRAWLEKDIEAYRYLIELASSGDDQAVDDVIDSWRRKNYSFFTGK